MAKLEDVFVVEADRQEPEKWSKIHLFKMGDFWRAYEWSAWLIAVITYNEKVRMTTRDCEWLLKQVPKVREFLDDELGLQLHMGKLHIQEIHKGVEFLGTFVKPYRDYISNKTLKRIKDKIQQLDLRNTEKANRTINSYLGILSHTASYNLRREMFGIHDIYKIIEFDADFLTSKPKAA